MIIWLKSLIWVSLNPCWTQERAH